MQDHLRLESEILVAEWGRWARSRHNLGFAEMNQPADMRASAIRSPLVADTTAAWVDSLVSKVEPQKARDALVMRYVRRSSLYDIGRELGCHRQTVARLLDQGLHQVGELLAAD